MQILKCYILIYGVILTLSKCNSVKYSRLRAEIALDWCNHNCFTKLFSFIIICFY